MRLNRNRDEIGELARRNAAAFLLAAESFRARERAHAQDCIGRDFGVRLRHMSHFGEHA